MIVEFMSLDFSVGQVDVPVGVGTVGETGDIVGSSCAGWSLGSRLRTRISP